MSDLTDSMPGKLSEAPEKQAVLVSDFDGTMTRRDFYQLAVESLIPADVPDYWGMYRAGSLTHFESLQRYFAAISASEREVLAVVERMGLDPYLARAVGELQHAGWTVVVTSAGCEWYIRRLLSTAGVDIEVHANPGRFEAGRGLVMELPMHSRFVSPTLGIDKAGVVQSHLATGSTVAFAGDGFPDAESARLVPESLRFARGDLAKLLDEEGLAYRPFEAWSDIARSLTQRNA